MRLLTLCTAPTDTSRSLAISAGLRSKTENEGPEHFPIPLTLEGILFPFPEAAGFLSD